MAVLRQTITRTRNNVDADEPVVNERRVYTNDAASGVQVTAANAILYLFGIIETLLALRFILRLFGANSANWFVNFVYSVTGVLTAPFDNIFGVAAAQAGTVRSVFEPSILVAMAVYAFIAWGIVKLITLNRRD